MIITTLSAIRAASPCAEGWTKLTKSLGGIREFGAKTELPVSRVLDSNGIEDALWVLAHACGKDGERICHVYACDVAERAVSIYEKHNPGDNRPRRAIETKRLWLDGKATDKELAAARDAAWDAARDVAWDVAWDVALAAARAAAGDAAWAAARDVAGDAAWAAARDAARDAAGKAEGEWQTARLRQLIEETK